MHNQTLTESLAAFDPEIYGLLQEEVQKQRFTLSLLPTSNAVSPFSAYLKGSIFGNGHLDHHAVQSHLQLEKIAAKRAEKLFGADHAIVRISDIAAASRVVFHALAESGDTILSFNRRKAEHCSGERMQYNFISFSIEPDTEQIDLGRVEQLVTARKPKIAGQLSPPFGLRQTQGNCEKVRRISLGGYWAECRCCSGRLRS